MSATAPVKADDDIESSSSSSNPLKEEEADNESGILQEEPDVMMECREALSIIMNDEFKQKYCTAGEFPDFYLFKEQPYQHSYRLEGFATVEQPLRLGQRKHELKFHPAFEFVICRYTGYERRPNPLLLATRSSDFCYRLSIRIEAVPREEFVQHDSLRLSREYQILSHFWESCCCSSAKAKDDFDFTIGVPMPFEFVNVPDTNFNFTDIHCTHICNTRGEIVTVNNDPNGLASSLSYMSLERVGPSISYLVELADAHEAGMPLSTALKIYDQLLCRLMVLHKYSIILGNLDTAGLNFGCREASHVLYINKFDCSVIAPTNQPTPHFGSSRFQSIRSARRKSAHFVQDIESAFYILLSLVTRVLPWDSSVAKKSVIQQKEHFWSDEQVFNRLIVRMQHEFTDTIYHRMEIDIIKSLYQQNKEIIRASSSLSQREFHQQELQSLLNSSGAYSTLRRTVATYFRYGDAEPNCGIDQLSSSSKLNNQTTDTKPDVRKMWDLNLWCWNALEPGILMKSNGALSAVSE